jgi:glycogen debranching enzyme
MDVIGAEELGRADRAVVLGADDGRWEASITETSSDTRPRTRNGAAAFDEVMADNDRAFRRWVDTVAPWRTDQTPAATLAAYVIWSASVLPQGELTRETVLMSKHWMDRVWSWDHAFVALALAGGQPDLALDQFLAPFDRQDAAGAIPDSLGACDLLWNYVKPPIHGWAFRLLRSALSRPLTRDELTEVYDRLAGWTRYWLDHRRAPGRALPYYQHGNDSGWDNATTFDGGRAVESPDLAAFLILQLEVLEELGLELGRPVEAWSEARQALLAALLDELWLPDGFTGVRVHSRERTTGTSLLMIMPFVLAGRLPDQVRRAMAHRLDAHLTEYGAATEPPESPHYDSDGYWRGPIWAPSTALLESGLRESGLVDQADAVRTRFLALCERSGFAENFDALSGEGLRDRAYTWTAAVYLMFCASAAEG